jgi:hypothetical protein
MWCDLQPLAQSIAEVPGYDHQRGPLLISSSTNKHLLVVNSYRRAIRMDMKNRTRQLAPNTVVIDDFGSNPKAFDQDFKRYTFSLGTKDFQGCLIFACQSVLL